MRFSFCTHGRASVYAVAAVGLVLSVGAMNLALSSVAMAGPNFNCASQAVGQFAALIETRYGLMSKTSYYLDEKGNNHDPRNTYEEEAKATGVHPDKIYAKYAATGRLLCPPGAPTTANLVIKNNVIVTAAHAFYDKQGEPRFKTAPYKCQFHVMRKSGPPAPNDIYDVDLKSIIEGSKKTGTKETFNLDWAVAKLTRPVPGVKPYEIDPDIDSKPFPIYGESASAGQYDRPDKNGRVIVRRALTKGKVIDDHPNLTHKCKTTDPYGPRENGVWQANCALGVWGSGSPFLVKSEDPKNPLKIAAIGINGPKDINPSEPQLGYSYIPDITSTKYVAVTGEFRMAIDQAIK